MESIRKIMRQQESLYIEFPASNDGAMTHWPIFDAVFTNMRVVFIQADERNYSPLAAAGAVLGLAGFTLMKAYEKYQAFKQDQKLDLEVLEPLLENAVALSIEPSDINKIVVAQVKIPFWAKAVSMGDIKFSWIIIDGKVRLSNEKLSCILGFMVEESKKSAAEYVEKNFFKKPFLIQEKIDKKWASFKEILTLR